MAINFSQLPTENPFSALPGGFYKGKIVKAEMKQPKDLAKKQYLEVTYDVVNAAGKSCGKLYDKLFDSDSQALLYKLSRFIQACKIPMVGTMELKDLAKVIVGKELVVDVGRDKEDKTQVEIFKHEVFYPIEQFAELVGDQGADEELPFTAGDAKDAPAAPAKPVEY